MVPTPPPARKFEFRRLALGLALFAGALLLGAAAFQFDGAAEAKIAELQGKKWKKSSARQFQGAVSRYGDWPFLMAAGGAGLLVAWRLRNGRWQRILITAMIASTVAGAVVNAARLTTGRTRPNASPDTAQGWYGIRHDGRWLIGNSKFNSFPSGHTATGVGFAAVILFASPAIGSVAMLAALAIAWSRMMLGAHHLSDVVVGTLVALGIAWFAWHLARRRGDEIAGWVIAKVRRKKS